MFNYLICFLKNKLNNFYAYKCNTSYLIKLKLYKFFYSYSQLLRPVDRQPLITKQPNTALLCTILALGTFFIAYYLRHFRNSKFLGRNVS